MRQINKMKFWNKIRKILNIKFHRMPVYDEKYIKAKAGYPSGKQLRGYIGCRLYYVKSELAILFEKLTTQI